MMSDDVPLVSVLIPAFNHERFVQRCLDSVLQDPYPAKELIVIDDGSPMAPPSGSPTGSRRTAWISRSSTCGGRTAASRRR